jgi:hypothetical protein
MERWGIAIMVSERFQRRLIQRNACRAAKRLNKIAQALPLGQLIAASAPHEWRPTGCVQASASARVGDAPGQIKR